MVDFKVLIIFQNAGLVPIVMPERYAGTIRAVRPTQPIIVINCVVTLSLITSDIYIPVFLMQFLVSCADNLSSVYKCDLSGYDRCDYWANDKNVCEKNWNSAGISSGGCVNDTSGLIKDYCRLSCDNCGEYSNKSANVFMNNRNKIETYLTTILF